MIEQQSDRRSTEKPCLSVFCCRRTIYFVFFAHPSRHSVQEERFAMSASKFLTQNYSEILALLNCLKVGVFITDGDANTLMVNDASCSTGGLTREETEGKNMRELEEIGFTEDTIIWKVLDSGREQTHIEKLGDGGQVFVTGTPMFENGKVDLVICTERNITETQKLKELLDESNRENKSIVEESLRIRKKLYYGTDDEIIAADEKSKLLLEQANRFASQDTTVLLTGESGTGKEVYAKYLHKHSNRGDKMCIGINCAAIPDNLHEREFFGYEQGAFTGADKHGKNGFFEAADGGTLFLDEIGELPVYMQAKLLRAIQEKEIIRVGGTKVTKVDVRLIVATNKELKESVAKGEFREDLYYRLSVIPLNIPPLRDRKDDIGAMAIHFINEFNETYRRKKVITEDAIGALVEYEWPGNVRELRNVIERAVISFEGDIIRKFQIERILGVPVRNNEIIEDMIKGRSLAELVQDYEKNILAAMVEKYEKDADIARNLKVNKATLSRKLKKYGVKEKNAGGDFEYSEKQP